MLLSFFLFFLLNNDFSESAFETSTAGKGLRNNSSNHGQRYELKSFRVDEVYAHLWI